MPVPIRHLARLSRQVLLAWAIAVYDLRSRFANTAGGFLWAMLQPLALIGTYWFVFSVGFKVQTVGGFPFVLYFLPAFAAWSFFAEAVNTSVNVVAASPHLVKKMVFPTEILPLTKVFAATVSHLILICVALVMLLREGIAISSHLPSLAYFWLACSLLALGFGWLLSALHVFFRDVGQIVSIVVGLWFWFTPVVWAADMLPLSLREWMFINPMFYIAEGYRYALLGTEMATPVWHATYFWAFTLAVLILGGAVFRRLKPEFAEII